MPGYSELKGVMTVSPRFTWSVTVFAAQNLVDTAINTSLAAKASRKGPEQSFGIFFLVSVRPSSTLTRLVPQRIYVPRGCPKIADIRNSA